MAEPRSTRRGGTSNYTGGDYEVALAVREALILLRRAREDPSRARRIGVQLRDDAGLSWDMCVEDAGMPRRWSEAKLAPTAKDVREVVTAVRTSAAASPDDEFELRCGETNSSMKVLERLTLRAREPGDLIAAERDAYRGLEGELVGLAGPGAKDVLKRLAVQPTSRRELNEGIAESAAAIAGPASAAMLVAAVDTEVRRLGAAKASADLRTFIGLTPTTAPIPLSPSPVNGALALLSTLPQSVPGSVLAAALGIADPDLPSTLVPLVASGLVTLEDGRYRSAVSMWCLSGADHAELLGVALDALNRYMETDRSGARTQTENHLVLAERCVATHHALVARAFDAGQHALKDLGDKHRVLDLAQLSIRAARMSTPRTNDEMRAEALALVCGQAWVLQRVGELDDARFAIDTSLRLAEEVGGWPETEAFALKCQGRVDRMRAEREHPESVIRAELLQSSEAKLLQAIARFAALNKPEEIGDAYSLLGRTYLVGARANEAKDAIAKARDLLIDERSKDLVDLHLLIGDWEKRHGEPARALAAYDRALVLTESRPEISEIRARALAARASLTSPAVTAVVLLEEAARIHDRQQEPEAAARLRVEALQRTNKMPKELVARAGNDWLLLFHAHQAHISAQAPGQVVARRGGRNAAYWDGVIRRARPVAASYRKKWRT